MYLLVRKCEYVQTPYFEIAVRKSLTEYGVMGHFKAEMRASVMNILNKNTERQVPPDMPEETKLLNELIREYLAWNGYMYSEQVLGVGEC